jgi:hypothetical protein
LLSAGLVALLYSCESRRGRIEGEEQLAVVGSDLKLAELQRVYAHATGGSRQVPWSLLP